MAVLTLELPAPAKLNLFIHIIGRRPNGYHNLQSVFQLIDYSDTINFTRRDDGTIQVQSNIASLPAEQNLIYKAAFALKTLTGSPYGVEISLHKKIPMGGGLGGGSSDTATTLLGLNELWQTQLSLSDLAALGLTLGADIPFFIQGHSAWVEGIGEQITPIELPEPWFLVIVPNCQVETAKIYAHPQLVRNTAPIQLSDFFAGKTHNAFEPLVSKDYPEIKHALDWLVTFTKPRLTGTGSCVFAAFEDYTKAEAIRQQVPSCFSSFIAKGLKVSPVHSILNKNKL